MPDREEAKARRAQAEAQGKERGRELTAARAAHRLCSGPAQLRLAAYETAAVCGDCFAPLPATASVTLTVRFLPTHDRYDLVPICLPCWLRDLTTSHIGHFRGLPYDKQQDQAGPQLHVFDYVRRLRCSGCGRPMRVELGYLRFSRLTCRLRCCCAECEHRARRVRDNARRRVHHEPIDCVVCGQPFTPQKSNATTCSGRCRARAARQRDKLR